MSTQLSFDVLELDVQATVEQIAASIHHCVGRVLRKKGAVVGVSGGVDSAVVAARCARALGPDRVLALFTPERHSAEDTLPLSRQVAESQGIETRLHDITDILQALGCYARQDAAVRSVLDEYAEGWKFKIVLPSVVADDRYRIFNVVARGPDGRELTRRLSPEAYRELVAATNLKQRTRKLVEYHHAERLGYAVAGTPNRLEYDQGFFVKGGDGAADFKPIAHLYKSQVYRLASHLGVPAEVCARPPTTDTYSLEQGQDEFYFSLPYAAMDLCLYAKNNDHPPEAVADALELTPEQVGRVFKDIEAKRRATRYLHLAPLLVERVPQVSSTAAPLA